MLKEGPSFERKSRPGDETSLINVNALRRELLDSGMSEEKVEDLLGKVREDEE